MTMTQESSAKSPSGRYAPRMKRIYKEDVIRQMKERFGYKNSMAVPRLCKIVGNMGIGEATQNIKIMDNAVEQLAGKAGQEPLGRRRGQEVRNIEAARGDAAGRQ